MKNTFCPKSRDRAFDFPAFSFLARDRAPNGFCARTAAFCRVRCCDAQTAVSLSSESDLHSSLRADPSFARLRDSSFKMAAMETNASGDATADVPADLFLDIDELQAHGINVADIKKLKASGICTVKGIEMITKKKLCAIKGLSEAKVDKIKEAVLKVSGVGNCLTTALQVRFVALVAFAPY